MTIEQDDCESLDIDIAFISAEEYFKLKNKNIILKLLIGMVKWIVSVFVFFADNDGGIRLDKGYGSFNTFTLRKSFSVYHPAEKAIGIKYTEPRYNKATKEFLPPALEINGYGIVLKGEKALFSAEAFKQEWKGYHIPAFTVLLTLILLLNWFVFWILAKVIVGYPASNGIGVVIGVSLCSLVMVALLAAYINIAVKAYRLHKRVIEANQ